jgi:hypothetical protein
MEGANLTTFALHPKDTELVAFYHNLQVFVWDIKTVSKKKTIKVGLIFFIIFKN